MLVEMVPTHRHNKLEGLQVRRKLYTYYIQSCSLELNIIRT